MTPAPSSAPPREPRQALLLCFGFDGDRLGRQPWYTTHGLALGLRAHGYRVTLVTDADNPPRRPGYTVLRVPGLLRRGLPSVDVRVIARGLRPERVFVVGGLLELARLRRLRLGAPVYYILASPRLRPSEILSVGPAALWRERRYLLRPLANALLPGALLRRAVKRSGLAGLVYLSPTTRERLHRSGLPRGNLLVPQLARAIPQPTVTGGRPRTLAYFGPPLAARGAWLALETFERACARGADLRLAMFLRPDDPLPLAALRRRIARSRWRRRITVEASHLDGESLGRRLAACDIFLLPFLAPISEVPLVVVEAATTGRPVILLDRPGIGDYGRRLGATVVDRPRDLTPAVLEHLRAPARRPNIAPRFADWRAATAPLLAEPPAIGEPPLRLIALCGTDGVGKTTLADALARELRGGGREPRRVWSRYRNYLSRPFLALMHLTGHCRRLHRDGTVVGIRDFTGSPLLAHLFLGLQTLDQILDILLRFRLRRGLLLADRSVYDTIVDLALDSGRPDFVFRRIAPLLLALLPEPRLVALVTRPAALVARDRPDVLLDGRDRARRLLYERLAREHDLPVIDNAGSLGETLRGLRGLLGETVAAREDSAA